MDDQGNEFPLTYEIADAATFSRVSENGYLAILGYLSPDNDVYDPRKTNNFGKIVCFSKDRNIGDEHSFLEIDDFLMFLAEDVCPGTKERVAEFEDQLYQKFQNDGRSDLQALSEISQKTDEFLHSIITESGAIVVPLKYEDSTGRLIYSIPESGCTFSVDDQKYGLSLIGYAYVTPDKIKAEYGDLSTKNRTNAISLLRSELDLYSDFLSGDTYRLVISYYRNVGQKDAVEWEAMAPTMKDGLIGQSFAEETLVDMFKKNVLELDVTARELLIKDSADAVKKECGFRMNP